MSSSSIPSAHAWILTGRAVSRLLSGTPYSQTPAAGQQFRMLHRTDTAKNAPGAGSCLSF